MNMPQAPAWRRFLTPRPWKWDAWLLTGCIVGAGLASIHMGQDMNWDLLNYHFYNPWAWLNGRIYGKDIVAAQLQTYHNPLPDIPFYLMVKAGWRPRTIAFMLAVPAGVAAFFLLKLVPLLFRDLPPGERWFTSMIAVVVGLTSAMAVGTLGTTMNEWPGTALTIAAIWVIIRALAAAPGAALPRSALVIAGALCGLATGAKLTYGTLAVALCAAILLRGPWQRRNVRRLFIEATIFGVSVLAGTAVTAGTWMWALWTHFANPIFPYGNIWFQSPWWGQYEVMSRTYGPHSLWEWLAFPFTLTSPKQFYVAEVPYVDARMPALYGLALLAGTAWLAQRIFSRARHASAASDGVDTRETWRIIGVFWVLAFALWTAQFSIYRYIVPLELLSGALLVALLRSMLRPHVAWLAIAVAGASLVASTTPPDWWRVNFGRQWFDVKVPRIEKNALVLLTSDTPIAYVLPFFPSDARFLGINNSINDPDRDTRLEESVARSIREHDGSMYALAFPAGAGAAALAAHGLVRVKESCSEVRANARISPIELCEAVRVDQPH